MVVSAQAVASLIMAVFAVASPAVAHAQEKFVAVLHLLTGKGTYEKSVIASTADGVSEMECDLRREAWLKQYGPTFDMASAQIQKESGKGTAYKVVCEKKSN